MAEEQWARRLAAALVADDGDAFVAVYDALLDDEVGYSAEQVDAVKELARTLAESGLGDLSGGMAGHTDDCGEGADASQAFPTQADESQRADSLEGDAATCDAGSADGSAPGVDLSNHHYALDVPSVQENAHALATSENGCAVTPEATSPPAELADDSGMHRKRRRRKARKACAGTEVRLADASTQTESTLDEHLLRKQEAWDRVADFIAQRWLRSIRYHAEHGPAGVAPYST